MTHISASGDTLMGTVPAGKVWQVWGCASVCRTRVVGANAAIRFVDSVTGAFVHTAGQIPSFAGVASSNATRINLAAGDTVVFHNANASTWDALVSYVER